MSDLNKLNDQTISETSSIGVHAKLTKIFNFESRQVTTILVDELQISQYRDGSGKSNAAAVSTQMNIQNFKDIEGTGEFQRMHEELKNLGGNPRPLPNYTTFY